MTYSTDLVWDSNIFSKVLQRYNREIFVKILKAEILLKLRKNKPRFAAKSHELLNIENREEKTRDDVEGNSDELHGNALSMMLDIEDVSQTDSLNSSKPETDDRIDGRFSDIKSAHHDLQEGSRVTVLYSDDNNYDDSVVEYEGGEYEAQKTAKNENRNNRGVGVDQVSRLQISRDRYLSKKRAQQVGVVEEGKSLVGSRINIYGGGGEGGAGDNSNSWRMHAILDCHTKWVDDGILAHVTHTLQVGALY